jgi:hypothetical protein
MAHRKSHEDDEKDGLNEEVRKRIAFSASRGEATKGLG